MRAARCDWPIVHGGRSASASAGDLNRQTISGYKSQIREYVVGGAFPEEDISRLMEREILTEYYERVSRPDNDDILHGRGKDLWLTIELVLSSGTDPARYLPFLPTSQSLTLVNIGGRSSRHVDLNFDLFEFVPSIRMKRRSFE